MTRDSFEILLNDLYDIYNSSKKSDIPNILDKYNGQEYDAIYQLLFKYNYPRNPLYNPDITTPKFIKLLIDTYSSGRRILKDEDFLIKNYNQNIKFEGLVEAKVSDVKDQITKDFDEKLEDKLNSTIEKYNNKIVEIQKEFDNKIEQISKFLEDYKSKIPELLKNSVKDDNENIEIKLNILWTEHEINIPSNLKYCTAGDRIITTDNNGSVIGLEIKDIYWDCVSIPDKIIKEITIDKLTSNF
jgi:hypothetical protein